MNLDQRETLAAKIMVRKGELEAQSQEFEEDKTLQIWNMFLSVRTSKKEACS